MVTNYEQVLKKQQNKIHLYTDNNWKTVRVYTLEIDEIKEDCVKVRLEIVNSDKNQLEVDVVVDVMENNFHNIHFKFPEDSEFIKNVKDAIIETLKCILEMIKRDIKDEDLVGERYREFKPWYSLIAHRYLKKDDE